MKSVNKVILVGNLGKDPELKYMSNGAPMAKISLATSERFKGKDGQWQERTDWHNVVAWQKLAQLVGQHLKKGNKVYVEGHLETRSWADRTTGEKRHSTEIVPRDLMSLDGKDNA